MSSGDQSTEDQHTAITRDTPLSEAVRVLEKELRDGKTWASEGRKKNRRKHFWIELTAAIFAAGAAFGVAISQNNIVSHIKDVILIVVLVLNGASAVIFAVKSIYDYKRLWTQYTDYMVCLELIERELKF